LDLIANKVIQGYTKSEPGAVATGSKRVRNGFVLSDETKFTNDPS